MESRLASLTGQAIPAQYFAPKKSNAWSTVFLIALFLAISVCEYIFAYHSVANGIVVALFIVLVVYLVIYIAKINHRIANCLESTSLIPMYILFTSSLPWFFINQQLLLPAVYTCILALCFWYCYRKKLNFLTILNYRKEKLFKYIIIGLGVGLVTGSIEYLVLRVKPAFPTFELSYFFKDIVFMLLFVGLGEELLFRGLIQNDLESAFGIKWAILGSAAIFSIMHLTWRSIPELAFVFAAGIILGFMYYKTKSLVLPVIMHAVNNVMLVAVLPYAFIN